VYELTAKGTAHLTLTPNHPALRSIALHASAHLRIKRVAISSLIATEALDPTPACYCHSSPGREYFGRDVNLRTHPEIKRNAWSALSESNEGELAISVSGGWVRLVEGSDKVEFAPIQLEIDYELNLGGNTMEGIVFRRECDQEVCEVVDLLTEL
jgi:transcription initiation factor TFIID subunit 2